MIRYDDMRPSWKNPKRVWTREDLAILGCSKSLVEWLNPNPAGSMLMIEPEDWFWRDSEWFKNTPTEIVSELRAVAGGHFGDITLSDQCKFLGIPLSSIQGKSINGVRGKWEGLAGAVSAEEYVLEHFKAQGAQGLACEGKAQSAWHMAMRSRYRRRTGKIPGFEKVNGKSVLEIPSEETAQAYIDALRDVRTDIIIEYQSNKKYYDKLWRVSFDDVLAFADVAGWEMIETAAYMAQRYGVGGGWPDITMRTQGVLSFVEVKVKDRLRGSQAAWVRDIARPLGLDISVVRVEAV